jgi:hypothetical protein
MVQDRENIFINTYLYTCREQCDHVPARGQRKVQLRIGMHWQRQWIMDSTRVETWTRHYLWCQLNNCWEK